MPRSDYDDHDAHVDFYRNRSDEVDASREVRRVARPDRETQAEAARLRTAQAFVYEPDAAESEQHADGLDEIGGES